MHRHEARVRSSLARADKNQRPFVSYDVIRNVRSSISNQGHKSAYEKRRMASSCPEWYGSGNASGAGSTSNNPSFGNGEADLLGFDQPQEPAHQASTQSSNDDAKNNNNKNWLGSLTGGLGLGGGGSNDTSVPSVSNAPPASSSTYQQHQYASPNTSNAFHHSTSTTAEEYGEVKLDPSAYTTPKPTGSQLGGAAVVGGVAGAVLAGPLVGIAAAAGGAYAATTRGAAGEFTRSTGQAASNLGQDVREFNGDHQITQQAWSGVQQGVQSVQQFEEQHKWGENTTRAAGNVWTSAREFEQKNEIGERPSVVWGRRGSRLDSLIVTIKLRRI